MAMTDAERRKLIKRIRREASGNRRRCYVGENTRISLLLMEAADALERSEAGRFVEKAGE